MVSDFRFVVLILKISNFIESFLTYFAFFIRCTICHTCVDYSSLPLALYMYSTFFYGKNKSEQDFPVQNGGTTKD